MKSRRRLHLLAGAAAVAVFVLLLVMLRLRWLPLIAAVLTYLGLLWAWRSRPGPHPVVLPEGVSRDDYAAALEALGEARRDLDRLAGMVPRPDAPMVRRMGGLVAAIRRHHEANPAHVPRTRSFVRHTLPRMVAAVAGYADLAGRAGPERDERLAGVAKLLEGFVPVLEKIDRACIEDDLMALEISVEVLNEQLDRDRDV